MSENKIDVKVYEDLVKEKQALIEVIGSQDSMLESYKKLGTPEQIDEALNKASQIVDNLKGTKISTVKSAMSELACYHKIGSVSDINKAIDKSTKIIESYVKLGTPTQLSKVLDITESYVKIGKPGVIKKSINEAIKTINKYARLGSPKELDKALNILESKIVDTKCDTIAAKYNTSSAVVRKMYEKVNDFKVVGELLDEGLVSKSKTKLAGKTTEKKVNESIIGRTIRNLR